MLDIAYSKTTLTKQFCRHYLMQALYLTFVTSCYSKPTLCSVVSILAMPAMTCFTKSFLVVVGVFANKSGSPQSTLGITFLSLKFLTVYLVIGESCPGHLMGQFKADVNHQLNLFSCHFVWTNHLSNVFGSTEPILPVCARTAYSIWLLDHHSPDYGSQMVKPPSLCLTLFHHLISPSVCTILF